MDSAPIYQDYLHSSHRDDVVLFLLFHRDIIQSFDISFEPISSHESSVDAIPPLGRYHSDGTKGVETKMDHHSIRSVAFPFHRIRAVLDEGDGVFECIITVQQNTEKQDSPRKSM